MINNMPKEREFATYMEEYEYEEFRDFLDGEIERIAKTGFQFRIEGRNMGWRKREGYKETEIRNTGDLFHAIANGIGDFSGRITVYNDRLEMSLSHHDAPTGEFYIITPKEVDDE